MCLKDSEKSSDRKLSPPKISIHENGYSNGSLSSSSSSSSVNVISGSISGNLKVSSPSCSPTVRRTPVTDVPSSRPHSNPTTSSSPITKAPSALSTEHSGSSKSLSLPAPHTTASVPHAFIPSYPSMPLDVMASSLLSSHSLKSAINPYLHYSRLKSAGVGPPGDSMMPVCRDPYCPSCLSSHLLAAGQNGKSCPPGCTQCDISKSPAFLTGGHHPSSSALAAAAYAQAQMMSLTAASQLPPGWGDMVCCGKRFLTYEEFLQHLRSHTSESLVAGAAAAAAVANMSPAAAHSLLGRTYPTPPLSPLSTARYHPYSKPTFMPPPASALFSLPSNPALHPAAAFPPYLFYNSKLGSTSHH